MLMARSHARVLTPMLGWQGWNAHACMMTNMAPIFFTPCVLTKKGTRETHIPIASPPLPRAQTQRILGASSSLPVSRHHHCLTCSVILAASITSQAEKRRAQNVTVSFLACALCFCDGFTPFRTPRTTHPSIHLIGERKKTVEERRAQKASHNHSRVTGHTILKAAQDGSGQAIISLTANRHGSSVFMHDTFFQRVQEEDPELQSLLESVAGRFQRLIFTGSGDTQPRRSAIAQAPAQSMFALKRLDEKTLS